MLATWVLGSSSHVENVAYFNIRESVRNIAYFENCWVFQSTQQRCATLRAEYSGEIVVIYTYISGGNAHWHSNFPMTTANTLMFSFSHSLRISLDLCICCARCVRNTTTVWSRPHLSPQVLKTDEKKKRWLHMFELEFNGNSVDSMVFKLCG